MGTSPRRLVTGLGYLALSTVFFKPANTIDQFFSSSFFESASTSPAPCLLSWVSVTFVWSPEPASSKVTTCLKERSNG